MSLTIKFYKTGDDPRVANKSLTEIAGLSGTNYVLKEDTSVQRPVILADGTFDSNANYCYIKEFGRYYFIENIQIVQGQLYEISCRCDVLTTAFKSGELGGVSGIVFRQQKDYNLYIDDGYFKCSNKPKIQTHAFSTELNDYSFILLMSC